METNPISNAARPQFNWAVLKEEFRAELPKTRREKCQMYAAVCIAIGACGLYPLIAVGAILILPTMCQGDKTA